MDLKVLLTLYIDIDIDIDTVLIYVYIRLIVTCSSCILLLYIHCNIYTANFLYIHVKMCRYDINIQIKKNYSVDTTLIAFSLSFTFFLRKNNLIFNNWLNMSQS